MRIGWMMFLVCALLLSGCGEKETTTTTKPAPPPTEKSTAVEQVKKSANEVVTQTTKMVEAGKQLAKDAGAATEETVKEAVTNTKEQLTTAAADKTRGNRAGQSVTNQYWKHHESRCP